MTIFFNFSPTSNHLHPLQVENCDSNSRLVVDEDDSGKLRLERVKRELLMHNDNPVTYFDTDNVCACSGEAMCHFCVCNRVCFT